jgi:hypothetical protein
MPCLNVAYLNGTLASVLAYHIYSCHSLKLSGQSYDPQVSLLQGNDNVQSHECGWLISTGPTFSVTILENPLESDKAASGREARSS